MKCSQYEFFLLYIIFLIPKFCILKLYKENLLDEFDNYYNENSKEENNNYHGKYRYNKNIFGKFEDYNDDNFQKPASRFEYIITYIKNGVSNYFTRFGEYFDDFKYMISKYKILFRRFSGNKNTNQTLLNKKYNNHKNYIDLMDYKIPRKLKEENRWKINNKKLEDNLNQSYPYNNTDLYNLLSCNLVPDLKVYYYHYFCNNSRVSKEEYLNRTLHGEFCEFYNNTQRICFCPVHFTSCRFGSKSKLKCMTKKLMVNNQIDLTKYYDTFNDEHTRIPILNNEKKIYNFSINVKCGLELDDSISGSNANFYLLNSNDKFLDFDIISTEYHNKTKNATQYKKEEIMDNTTKILDYFIKKKNLVLFFNTSFYLKFNLIDQMWAIPYRTKFYEIKENILEDFLSGKTCFNFTVDINDILKNEDGEGPFSKTENDFKYPYFDKGDIHFFEIEIVDVKYSQIKFMPFRGEIKK